MISQRKVFERIYQAVKRVPRVKVATYGQIAQMINDQWLMVNGKKIDARMVGWALHVNRDPQVPCHRVVNREGRLATTFGMGGWQEQRRRLLAEGVKFKDEKHVDLKKYLWPKPI